MRETLPPHIDRLYLRARARARLAETDRRKGLKNPFPVKRAPLRKRRRSMPKSRRPFFTFETYRIPRRVSHAYSALLNDRESLQNLLALLDNAIWDLNAKDMETHFSSPPASSEAVLPFLRHEHYQAVGFAETMLFGRIVDSLNIYLADVCTIMDLNAAHLIAADGLTRFCCIGVRPTDPIAERLKLLSKASFPQLISELKKRKIEIPPNETLNAIERIRATRNYIVHRRGIAGVLVSQISPPPNYFSVEEDLIQPLGANAKVYIAAMEHVLSFCADIDVQAVALSNLPTRGITLLRPNRRPGKQPRTRSAKRPKRSSKGSAPLKAGRSRYRCLPRRQ